MDNRILVPLDGTESISQVLLNVKSITPQSATEITLLQVLSNRQEDEHVNSHVEQIYTALSDSGWNVSRDVRMGDAIEEIMKFTMLWPATMLLMSTHSRSGLDRIREGSVTEQVLKQSSCPVFILHTAQTEPADLRTQNLFHRILVPLDGTKASSAILSCVERFAQAHDSEVILFHDEMESADVPGERHSIKAKLQEHCIELANSGLKVSLDMTTYKRPIREILNKIDEMKIDLVSMVTHGESGNRRALDESVTAEVIRHSNCPLLVWSAAPQCPPFTKI